jgi:uncharacterized protein
LIEPSDSLAGRLQLADWRRRVAALYAEVRELATDDPEAAWNHWRAGREHLYREHPQSPVPAARRSAFRADHWPYDPRWRLEVAVLPDDPPAAPAVDDGLRLPISTGGSQAFSRVGWLDLAFPGRRRRLGLFWMAGYAGGLFLPFRDATNGAGTYGAGRYLLDAAKSADLGGSATDGTLIIDFNFAYQPSCAFDPRWSCPLAPPENRLDLRIEAGERLSGGGGSPGVAFAG